MADLGIILTLFVFALISRLAFLYRGGTGDADAMVMAAGMAQSLTPGVSFTDAMLYGRQMGPGIYLLFRLVFPAFLNEPSQVLPFLNAVGMLSGTLLVWPIYVVFRWTFRRPIAAAATVLILLSPLVWEVGTYFHPILPASLLLGLAMLSWRRMRSSRGGVGSAILTFALGLSALLMWAEVVLALPALLAATMVPGRRRSNLAWLFTLAILGGLSYLGVILVLQHYTHGSPTELPTYIGNFIASYFRMSVVPRSMVWSFLAIGSGTLALVAARLIISLPSLSRAWRNDWGDPCRLTAAALWVAVPLVFWLPNPVPLMRHYFLVVPGVVWILARLLPGRMSFTRLACGLLMLLAVNLLLPEAVYRTYNRTHPQSPKAPHGTFFYHHRETEGRIDRYHDLVSRIREARSTPTRGALVQVGWEGFGYVLYGLAAESGFVPGSTIEFITSRLPVRVYPVGDGHVRLLLAEQIQTGEERQTLADWFRGGLAAGDAVLVSREMGVLIGATSIVDLDTY